MFKVSAQLVGMIPKVDSSASVRFITQELPACDKLKLIEHLNLAGWLIFSEDDISEADIPEEKSGYEEGKTPSARLRNIIYVYWKEKKSDAEPIFDNYYKKVMEKQIEVFKEKLNE